MNFYCKYKFRSRGVRQTLKLECGGAFQEQLPFRNAFVIPAATSIA